MMVTKHDKMVCCVISFIIPIIGVILFFSWMGNKDTEKRKLGRTSLYFALASFLIFLFIGVINLYSF